MQKYIKDIMKIASKNTCGQSDGYAQIMRICDAINVGTETDTSTMLVVGNTYRFGGYDWIVAEIKGNCAVLQSCGVTSGAWPGCIMSQFGNGDWYKKDIDGLDISEYDDKTASLYKRIKDAEFADADYGKGLFLVSNTKIEQALSAYKDTDYYWQALKTAAGNYFLFGASNYRAWLGTCYGGYNAYCVNSGGNVNNYDQYNSYVVAPAFNLDLSKVEISGSNIIIKEGVKSEDTPESQSALFIMKNQIVCENTHAYHPRFTDTTGNCLLLDSVWDVDGCLAYADAHNMDVLYTETKASDTLEFLMAFQKKGYKIELRERKVLTPDGLELSPRIEVYMTKDN